MKRSSVRERRGSQVAPARARRISSDPLLDLSGDIDGLPSDLSRAFDRYLAKTFAGQLPVTRLRGS